EAMKKIMLALLVVPVALVAAPSSSTAPTVEQFLAPGYPTQVVSAKSVDRIAWSAYEHGQRNVYTAVAPEFKAVRLTNFTKDDGYELEDVSISDDGSVVTFVRGKDGWRRREQDRRGDDAGAVAGRSHGRVREGWTDLQLPRRAGPFGPAGAGSQRTPPTARQGLGEQLEPGVVA